MSTTQQPNDVLQRLLDERLANAAKHASAAISDAHDWTVQARRPSHDELMRRRYPPTGDPELWVRYGPAGPPDGVPPLHPVDGHARRHGVTHRVSHNGEGSAA